MARLPAGLRRSDLIELLDINDQLKALTARKEELVDKAKRAHAGLPAATYPYGPAVVLLKESGKFDVDAFTAAHPVEREPKYYAQTVDTKTVSKELRAGFLVVTRSFEVKRAATTVKPAA